MSWWRRIIFEIVLRVGLLIQVVLNFSRPWLGLFVGFVVVSSVINREWPSLGGVAGLGIGPHGLSPFWWAVIYYFGTPAFPRLLQATLRKVAG